MELEWNSGFSQRLCVAFYITWGTVKEWNCCRGLLKKLYLHLQIFLSFLLFSGFTCGSAGKESACNAGDLGSIPGLGRSPEEGKGYPPQYSGLENSMDCIVHGVTKSQIRLSNFHSLQGSAGFPGDSALKNPPANAGDMSSIPESERSPWRRKWQPTPVFLPGEFPWTEKTGRLQSMES